MSDNAPLTTAAEEVREVVLDGVREMQPAEWDPDDGVDEWGFNYERMVEVVLAAYRSAPVEQRMEAMGMTRAQGRWSLPNPNGNGWVSSSGELWVEA